jgi:sortase A
MRVAAAGLAFAATGLLAWLAVTMFWGDPFTAASAARAQTTLRHELTRERVIWHSGAEAPRPETARERARAFRAGLREGDAVGVIAVPRLHLRMVVVEGTAASDLARGPGHYQITALPGLRGTVAIAGHRTTYLQPFRHLDRLRAGDHVYLEMPYGTFSYRVYARDIVGDHDWSILRRRPFEKLVLSSCHPLYSASHRIVVFARLSGESARSAVA